VFYRQQNFEMQKIVSLAAAIVLAIPPAWSHCTSPPRLICAEYSNSELVVIAALTNGRYEKHTDRDDAHIFTLRTIKTLRGEVGDTFQITDPNSTARASFDWKRGRSYLLFLKPVGDGTWWLESCGYSGPLNQAGPTLKVIASLKERTNGLINGTVIGAHSWISKAGITIKVHGDARNYIATTDGDGNFSIHVIPGHYQVLAIEPGSTFQTDPYSNENPNNITIQDGGCAQITFVMGEEKYRNQ
jgi:hypothetical protein